MGKTSKNLGITKACPTCRKTVIKSANFSGYGTFNTKCPHCNSPIKVEVRQETSLKVFAIIVSIILIIGAITLFTTIKPIMNNQAIRKLISLSHE